jgi:putative tryptophan/tyrosine transport system substrate-binding protein
MRRRGFITLLGGAAAWPIAAFAQQRLPRVGVLLYGHAVPSGDLQIATELGRTGYVEGRNIAYEIRGAEGDITRLPALAPRTRSREAGCAFWVDSANRHRLG